MMELEKEFDPFVPHETVFSKYAAVIYTSIDLGKTFEVLKEIKFCLSCGEKVSCLNETINNTECNNYTSL